MSEELYAKLAQSVIDGEPEDAEQLAVTIHHLGGTGGREGFRQRGGQEQEEEQDCASCYDAQSRKGDEELFHPMLHDSTCDASAS